MHCAVLQRKTAFQGALNIINIESRKGLGNNLEESCLLTDLSFYSQSKNNGRILISQVKALKNKFIPCSRQNINLSYGQK